MVRSMCANFVKERRRKNALTVPRCHYIPMWCDFLLQQSLHIVAISWMILSWKNAWHGLQRLARKRSFHGLVWHSGCCLSFNALFTVCALAMWMHTRTVYREWLQCCNAAMLLQVVILLSMHPSPSCGSKTHGWQISKSIKSMKFGAACTLWRRTASGSGTAAFQEPKNLRSYR